MKVKVLVTQLCAALCDPTDCSPPGSSVHGILQARILEWVAIPCSRGSSQPRDGIQVSCIAVAFFFFYCLSHRESSGQLLIAPERMKPLGQSENNVQLWICVVVKIMSNAIKNNCGEHQNRN